MGGTSPGGSSAPPYTAPGGQPPQWLNPWNSLNHVPAGFMNPAALSAISAAFPQFQPGQSAGVPPMPPHGAPPGMPVPGPSFDGKGLPSPQPNPMAFGGMPPAGFPPPPPMPSPQQPPPMPQQPFNGFTPPQTPGFPQMSPNAPFTLPGSSWSNNNLWGGQALPSWLRGS